MNFYWYHHLFKLENCKNTKIKPYKVDINNCELKDFANFGAIILKQKIVNFQLLAKMTLRYLFYILLFFFSSNLSAQNKKKSFNYPKYKVNFGSFIQHLEPPGEGTYYIQHLGNQLISVSMKVHKKTYISVGTGLNSFGDRLFLLGINHVWHSFSPKLHIDGIYAYAGEFFFDAFNHAGKEGIYNSFKEATGLGWIPLIYHGVKYDMYESFSIKLGLLAPTLIFASLEFSIFNNK